MGVLPPVLPSNLPPSSFPFFFESFLPCFFLPSFLPPSFILPSFRPSFRPSSFLPSFRPPSLRPSFLPSSFLPPPPVLTSFFPPSSIFCVREFQTATFIPGRQLPPTTWQATLPEKNELHSVQVALRETLQHAGNLADTCWQADGRPLADRWQTAGRPMADCWQTAGRPMAGGNRPRENQTKTNASCGA